MTLQPSFTSLSGFTLVTARTLRTLEGRKGEELSAGGITVQTLVQLSMQHGASRSTQEGVLQ